MNPKLTMDTSTPNFEAAEERAGLDCQQSTKSHGVEDLGVIANLGSEHIFYFESHKI